MAAAIRVVPVTAADRSALPQADFADAFAILVDEPGLDAPTAARRVFVHSPGWVRALAGLRNQIVGVFFGLKTPETAGAGPRVGWFPLVSSAPDRVVLGIDDKHQDFRVVVTVTAHGTQTQVTVSTIVRTHNALGRCYLAAVMPFHRIIVPTMLRQAANT